MNIPRISHRNHRYLAIAILASLLVVAGGRIVHAQVTVSLQQPPPNQLKVADLWKVTLINTSRSPVSVYLHGTAKEARAGLVVDAQSTIFTVPPGTKLVSGRDVSPIKVNSSNGRYKNIMLQTGTVPAGDYTICVSVIDAKGGEELGNDCIEQKVESASLILMTPADAATVDENLPIFLWTSTPPLGSSATYAIKIVEVLGSQNGFSAMQSNTPFYQQQDIHTTTLQYPISAPKFIVGRNYAWQITASDNGAALNTSEVWSFTYKTADSVVPYSLKKKKTILAQFQALYGGADYDHGWAIQETKDTGFILAGYTRSFGAGNDDGILIKTDRAGAVEWANTYGGSNDDGFYAVTQVSDGGFVAVGFTRSFDVGNDDIYVVKTNKDGNLEYSTALGGGGFDAAYSAIPSTEDGVILAGTIGKGDDYDVFVAELDKGGHARWGTNLGGFQCDVAHALLRTKTGFLVAGYTRSSGAGNDDIYALFLNREGGVVSSAVIGNTEADRGYAVTTPIGPNNPTFAAPEYYTIAGYRPNDAHTDAGDITLVSLSPDGGGMAAKDYNAGSIDKGISITPTQERGYVVTGFTAGDSAKPAGIVAFQVKYDGSVDWSRFYQDSKLDEGYGITHTVDGGYAIVGYSEAGPDGDIVLIKTDPKGVVGCTDIDGGVQMKDARVVGGVALTLQDRGVNSRSVKSIATKAPIIATMLCPKPTKM